MSLLAWPCHMVLPIQVPDSANYMCCSGARGLNTEVDFWCGAGDHSVKCLQRRASNTEDGVPAFGCAMIFSVGEYPCCVVTYMHGTVLFLVSVCSLISLCACGTWCNMNRHAKCVGIRISLVHLINGIKAISVNALEFHIINVWALGIF